MQFNHNLGYSRFSFYDNTVDDTDVKNICDQKVYKM